MRTNGIADVLWLAAAVSAAATVIATTAAAQAQTFEKPGVSSGNMGIAGVSRLDWCWRHQRQCGKTAADLYCKAKGFQTATAFSKDPGLNVTVSMGDKAVCKQGICDGFVSITCRKS